MFKLSSKSKANREGIDPRLIEIDDLAIQLSLVDYGHGKYAGKRKAKLQNELFVAGKSKCDGYDKLSKHQLGKALDFYAYVNNKTSWEHEHLTIVACAYFQAASILGYKIKWGGLWKRKNPKYKNGIPYGWDMPHIELID
jgi:peptidoglycan L-alanyl-D-glutamate endopeptidase CwlK